MFLLEWSHHIGIRDDLCFLFLCPCRYNRARAKMELGRTQSAFADMVQCLALDSGKQLFVATYNQLKHTLDAKAAKRTGRPTHRKRKSIILPRRSPGMSREVSTSSPSKEQEIPAFFLPSQLSFPSTPPRSMSRLSRVSSPSVSRAHSRHVSTSSMSTTVSAQQHNVNYTSDDEGLVRGGSRDVTSIGKYAVAVIICNTKYNKCALKSRSRRGSKKTFVTEQEKEASMGEGAYLDSLEGCDGDGEKMEKVFKEKGYEVSDSMRLPFFSSIGLFTVCIAIAYTYRVPFHLLI